MQGIPRLKPGNVMITKSGAKLLDFGLAKPVQARGGDRELREKALTETGMVVGTLQYMAPEQLTGRELDARTDIFALGATLYEMLTAKPARPRIPGCGSATVVFVTNVLLRGQAKPMTVVVNWTGRLDSSR